MRKRRKRGVRKSNCSSCNKPVEETRKGQRYCKSCHAKNMRKNRPKHSELPTEIRLKANARSYVNVYLRRGKIEKKPCEICKDENSQMHHDDYDKPLEVRWFCRKHHLEFHKNKSNEKQIS